MILPWSNRAIGFQSANDRPVFATIGLRNQGWAITQKTTGFADFAALVDVDSKVLGENVENTEKGQNKKPDAYKDYRKILERKDIDAVMIATPDHWHTKMCVEAMYAGKDVYCEKPLTLTIDEGKLIEKVVKETGRVFQVGTMQRTECGHRFLQAVAAQVERTSLPLHAHPVLRNLEEGKFEKLSFLTGTLGYFVSLPEPRTFGLTVTAHFGNGERQVRR